MNRKQERKLQFNLWRYLGRAGDTGGEALSSAETSFGAVFVLLLLLALGQGRGKNGSVWGMPTLFKNFP